MKIVRSPVKADVPSMAMGDIAFNLLVFFVILARAQDDRMPWTPAKGVDLEQTRTARARIVIDRDEKLYLDGHEIGVGELRGSLEQILGDSPAGQRIVFLKVHNTTHALRFEPVIEAVSQAGGELMHVLDKQQE